MSGTLFARFPTAECITTISFLFYDVIVVARGVWMGIIQSLMVFIIFDYLRLLLSFRIFSWLSRSNTSRGSCSGPVTVGPTKIQGYNLLTL